MSVRFRVLVYFVNAWFGMLDNGGFFDIEGIVPKVLVSIGSKMVKNTPQLAKIMVCLEYRSVSEISFFSTAIISSIRVFSVP